MCDFFLFFVTMNEIYLLVGMLLGYAGGQKLTAVCEIEATSGKDDYPLEGKVTFMQEPGQNVTIDIVFQGFNTTDDYDTHGFHVHEKGNLSNGCLAAGSHFNPEGVEHAGPQNITRHVGDLGNIVEGDDGSIIHSFTDHVIQLEGNHSIIGRSIVVHERDDDLGLGGYPDSKTTGHAGARLGCCVIALDMTTTSSGAESGMTSSGSSGDMTTASSGGGSGGSGATTMDQMDDDSGGRMVLCSAVLVALAVALSVLGWLQ